MQPSLPFADPAPDIETAHDVPVPTPAVPVVPPTAARELVFVRHPRARRYIIRVAGDGSVRITIPRWGSKREAAAFAAREHAWIARQRQRLARQRSTRQGPGAASLDAHALAAMRARADVELPARLLQLAARHGLTVSRVSVRNQKWRWGSCSPGGHICLNWRLVAMPDEVRDYVIVHELMHLKRMDHSPKFWKLVAAACPEYQAARRYLRSFDHVEVDGGGQDVLSR